MLLGLIVAAIFLTIVFSYQVRSTELAVVVTMGKVSVVKEAGLHFRMPPPIQKVYLFDKRPRCFDGSIAKLEETYTSDGQNIIVGIYVLYNIADAEKFFLNVASVTNAEDKLNSLMRGESKEVFGKYSFDQMINTKPEMMQLDNIEKELKERLKKKAAEQYGINVSDVGIKTIGLPETITKSVFDRMKNERAKAATEYRSQGNKLAEIIRSTAESERTTKLAEAEANAKRIRAEGDAEAAKYYAVFAKNPELASFLKKLDSMKKIIGNKTTLVLDTDSAPFDILKMNSDKLGITVPPKAGNK
ncbi:MAG: hypothetical protein A2X49_04390 [Lentisphaerae bacterium GWF2_52_8]|nr:MAG: hypothetical protein A2X49_04390 [Lentisphaerae bacterium GWF2_52_8]